MFNALDHLLAAIALVLSINDAAPNIGETVFHLAVAKARFIGAGQQHSGFALQQFHLNGQDRQALGQLRQLSAPSQEAFTRAIAGGGSHRHASEGVDQLAGPGDDPSTRVGGDRSLQGGGQVSNHPGVRQQAMHQRGSSITHPHGGGYRLNAGAGFTRRGVHCRQFR